MSTTEVTVTPEVIELAVVDEPLDLTVEETVQQVDVTVSEVDVTVQPEILEIQVVEDVIELTVSDGPAGPAGPASEDSVPYDKEIDEPVPGVLYIGEAQPGTATDEGAWRIRRVTQTGTGSSTEWAGGTAAFDKVWDDRVSLPYGP